MYSPILLSIIWQLPQVAPFTYQREESKCLCCAPLEGVQEMNAASETFLLISDFASAQLNERGGILGDWQLLGKV